MHAAVGEYGTIAARATEWWKRMKIPRAESEHDRGQRGRARRRGPRGKTQMQNRAARRGSAGRSFPKTCAMMELDVIAASSGFRPQCVASPGCWQRMPLGINEIDDELTVVELLLTSLTLMVFRFEGRTRSPITEMEIVPLVTRSKTARRSGIGRYPLRRSS